MWCYMGDPFLEGKTFHFHTESIKDCRPLAFILSFQFQCPLLLDLHIKRAKRLTISSLCAGLVKMIFFFKALFTADLDTQIHKAFWLFRYEKFKQIFLLE